MLTFTCETQIFLLSNLAPLLAREEGMFPACEFRAEVPSVLVNIELELVGLPKSTYSLRFR